MVAVVGRQDFGAGLQRAHRALRQRGLHPAAGVVQALAAASVLRRGAVGQRGRCERRAVVRPAPAAPPASAAMGCTACTHNWNLFAISMDLQASTSHRSQHSLRHIAAARSCSMAPWPARMLWPSSFHTDV